MDNTFFLYPGQTILCIFLYAVGVGYGISLIGAFLYISEALRSKGTDSKGRSAAHHVIPIIFTIVSLVLAFTEADRQRADLDLKTRQYQHDELKRREAQ